MARSWRAADSHTTVSLHSPPEKTYRFSACGTFRRHLLSRLAFINGEILASRRRCKDAEDEDKKRRQIEDCKKKGRHLIGPRNL
ncbi:hypothetical protein JOB18_001100 [Solea senegalensis]|uniref:Uncharacterized protein n=1 Tax=Solea senegalensis TaxID=28829 RepID=A0AAV6SWR6_SOLSE|nr:hypothetical protein JOB18_001100 [Solea senegalensis]